VSRHIPIALSAALGSQLSSTIVENYPGLIFETTTPEAAGWSVEKVAEVISWSQQIAPTAAVKRQTILRRESDALVARLMPPEMFLCR
jgi:hypothetical protein